MTQPTRLTVTPGLAGDHLLGELPLVAIDDTAVPLSAAGTGEATVSAPGRHVLRVTGSAPVSQLAWLDITPAAS